MPTEFDPVTKNVNIALSGANLTATLSSAFQASVKTTTAKSSGKWYAEFTITDEGSIISSFVGIAPNTTIISADGFTIGATISTNTRSYYSNNGYKYPGNGTSAAYGASWTLNDVISVLLDLDAGTLSYRKNGADQGTAYTGLAAVTYNLVFTLYGGGTSSVVANFGDSAWAGGGPPGGYLGWGLLPPEPSIGNGAVTLQSLTATGSRIAAGEAILSAITGVGGYNGIGAVTLEQLVLAGGGGVSTGTVTMAAFTASGTGSQAARGVATFSSLTATGTGYDSEIWTFAGSASIPTLSSLVLTGEAITFAGTAPVPILEIGTKDAVLVMPAPVLVATLLPGRILTVAVKAPVPVLVAVNDNPAIITIAGTAQPPILVATLLAGQILTFAGSVRAPVLSSSGLTGSVATILASAVAPILSATGYSAFTITVASSAPAPRLVAALGFAVSENYRTWCLNVRKGALTEYNNFSFNSFATFNGQVIAAGSSGIVVLGTQDLDNATAITAKVRSGRDSFGSSFHKRVPRAYIGYTPSGDMLFRMITPEGGERTYLLGWNNGTDLQQRRIPIGKGPKSRYWQWEVENVAGASFEIDNVMLYPVKLRRRAM